MSNSSLAASALFAILLVTLGAAAGSIAGFAVRSPAGRHRRSAGAAPWRFAGAIVGLAAATALRDLDIPSWMPWMALPVLVLLLAPCPSRLKKEDGWDSARLLVLTFALAAGVVAGAAALFAAGVGLAAGAYALWRWPAAALGTSGAVAGLGVGAAVAHLPGLRRVRVGTVLVVSLLGLVTAVEFWRAGIEVEWPHLAAIAGVGVALAGAALTPARLREATVGAPPEAAAPAATVRRPWLIFVVLSTMTFLTGVDQLGLNVALPSLAHDVEASSGELTWIVSSYMLAYGALLLLGGSFGDRRGRRVALVVGLVLFGGASVVGGFAQEPWQLIAGRAVMGVGAAFMVPTGLSTVKAIFPKDKMSRATSTWTIVWAVGVALGPLIGGQLVERGDWSWAEPVIDGQPWRWVFFMNTPVVLLALMGAWRLVPESKDPAHAAGSDLPGTLLSMATLGLVLFGVIEAPERGWTDRVVVWALAGGATAALLFVIWERRATNPMLDVRLFRVRGFSGAVAAMSFVWFVLSGTIVLLTQHLQDVEGRSPAGAGVMLLWMVIPMIAVSLPSPKLVRLLGTRAVVGLGAAVLAADAVALSRLGLDSPGWYLEAVLGVGGLGMGLAMAPMTHAITVAVPPGRTGAALATNSAAGTAGSALGVAVLVSVAATVYRDRMEDAVAGLPPALADAASDRIGAAVDIAARLGAAGRPLRAAAMHEFVEAMSQAMLVAAGVAIAAMFLALLLPGRDRARRAPASRSGAERRHGRHRGATAT